MNATVDLPVDAPPVNAAKRTTRFVFVDALRGLAAVGVVACHFVPQSSLVPALVVAAMQKGSLGVQMFFVISGFVIAYSAGDAQIGAGYLGNFALRRALRLDPPYWATIACILIVGGWTQQWLPSSQYHAPSVPQVFAHLAYAQTFLGHHDLCVVFWTLRLEVMFYLLFIVLLGLAQRLGRAVGSNEKSAPWRLLLVLPIALCSLAAFTLGRGPGVLQYFHMFLTGACVWWTLARQISAVWLAMLIAAMLATLGWHFNWETPVAVATAVAIFACGRAGRLTTWLNVRPLQHLGRISYSLYLIHAPLGGLVLAAGLHFCGTGPLATIGWSVAAIAASLPAAELLYRFVEAPSIVWANRLKRSQPGGRMLTATAYPAHSRLTASG